MIYNSCGIWLHQTNKEPAKYISLCSKENGWWVNWQEGRTVNSKDYVVFYEQIGGNVMQVVVWDSHMLIGPSLEIFYGKNPKIHI